MPAALVTWCVRTLCSIVYPNQASAHITFTARLWAEIRNLWTELANSVLKITFSARLLPENQNLRNTPLANQFFRVSGCGQVMHISVPGHIKCLCIEHHGSEIHPTNLYTPNPNLNSNMFLHPCHTPHSSRCSYCQAACRDLERLHHGVFDQRRLPCAGYSCTAGYKKRGEDTGPLGVRLISVGFCIFPLITSFVAYRPVFISSVNML